MRLIRKLGALDQIVEWFRPVRRPAWMTNDRGFCRPPESAAREVRYSVARKGFCVKSVTLVTTLFDPKVYTLEKFADAYGLRWTIATSFGDIKTTMKMDVLRCQTERGILQAAQQQDVPVDRINVPLRPPF